MYISVNHVCYLEDDKGLSHTNDKTRQMFAVVAVIDDVVAVVVVFVAADDDVVVVVTAASAVAAAVAAAAAAAACISRPHYSVLSIRLIVDWY